MDKKVTLSFNEEVIDKAKEFASSKGISLSRLTEYLFERITVTPKSYDFLDDLPVADFISQLAEDQAVYKKTDPKTYKTMFNESRK